MDANMDFIPQIGGLDSNVNLLDNIPILFNDTFFGNQVVSAKFQENWAENFPGVFNQGARITGAAVEPTVPSGGSKKRKLGMDVAESSSGNNSGIKRKNSSRNGSEKGEDKPREVVHVRARRGQATDSHSVAERVRRGKINERMRCLQDIVPGCYKTMGMAVMLDEIINYVQSLQNQVEFLSMKLTAASTYHDFNSQSYAAEKRKRAEANEAKEWRERNGGFGPFDLSFSPSSTLPY